MFDTTQCQMDNLMVYKEPNMSDTELNFGYRTSLIYKALYRIQRLKLYKSNAFHTEIIVSETNSGSRT